MEDEFDKWDKCKDKIYEWIRIPKNDKDIQSLVDMTKDFVSNISVIPLVDKKVYCNDKFIVSLDNNQKYYYWNVFDMNDQNDANSRLNLAKRILNTIPSC
jgi:hypothetical protein